MKIRLLHPVPLRRREEGRETGQRGMASATSFARGRRRRRALASGDASDGRRRAASPRREAIQPPRDRSIDRRRRRRSLRSSGEGKKKYLSAAARPSRSRVARRTKSPIHSVDPPASSAPPFSAISPAVPRARVNAARASLAMGRAPDAGSLVGLNTFIRGPRAIARFASTTGRGARARFVLRRDDATPCARRYDASGTTIRRGRAMRVSRVRVPRAGMPRADVAAARVSSFILFRDDIRSAYYAQAMKSYEQTVRPLRMSLTGQLRVRRLTTTSKKRGRQLTFRLERDWMSGSNERCRAVCGVNESDEK